MANTVIFLDVDGVLITGRPNWKTPHKPAIDALNKLLADTNAAIVVSSCWRIGRTVAELDKLLLSWGVAGEVVGRTGGMGTQRGYEIGAFLTASPEITRYVILDDDSDMAGLIGKLVQTNAETGLTMADVERAKVIIGN